MKKRFNIYIGLLATMFLLACSKEEILGPDIYEAENSTLNVVTGLSSSSDNWDFTSGDEVTFSASLENVKEWTVTITGQVSGASKVFTGTSKDIAVNWDGSTGGSLPIFQNENVDVVLSFPKHSGTTESLTRTITTAYGFSAKNKVMITDFTLNKGWASDWPANTFAVGPYPTADGGAFMINTGTPWQGNGSPYVDNTVFEASNAQDDLSGNTNDDGDVVFPLYADAKRVYFNVLMYNTGTQTWNKFILESPSGNNAEIDIYPNWNGWKLVSIPLDEANWTNENNIDPTNFSLVRHVLLSTVTGDDLPGPEVSTVIDYMCFTHDGPLEF